MNFILKSFTYSLGPRANFCKFCQHFPTSAKKLPNLFLSRHPDEILTSTHYLVSMFIQMVFGSISSSFMFSTSTYQKMGLLCCMTLGGFGNLLKNEATSGGYLLSWKSRPNFFWVYVAVYQAGGIA